MKNPEVKMPEEILGIESNVMPLDKLISRLKTDMKLSKSSWIAQNCSAETVSTSMKNKNLKKLSIIYYLEKLQQLQNKLAGYQNLVGLL